MSRARPIPHVVTVEALLALVKEPDVRVVDVRWRLGEPGWGRSAYDRGHIPGAVFADLDRDLAGPPGALGRHPLPEPDRFAAAMHALGIGERTRVVACDDQGGAFAGRLWFLLRYFGHETAAVLDGGVTAYLQAGHVLSTLPAPVAAVDAAFVPRPRPDLVMERPALEASLGRGDLVLIDARSRERFRGVPHPADPRPGHIPGAVSAPFSENLSDGRMRSPAELRARYDALGAAPRVAYCGSGVTACLDLLALAVAGDEDARLYRGSWSEWSEDPAAGCATGD